MLLMCAYFSCQLILHINFIRFYIVVAVVVVVLVIIYFYRGKINKKVNEN